MENGSAKVEISSRLIRDLSAQQKQQLSSVILWEYFQLIIASSFWDDSPELARRQKVVDNIKQSTLDHKILLG